MPHCSKSHYVPWYEQSATKAWLIVVCCSNVFCLVLVCRAASHTGEVAIENVLNNRRTRIKNSIKTVFLIAICRQSDDTCQSKTLFLTILIYVRRLYWRFRLPPNRCVPISVISSFVIIWLGCFKLIAFWWHENVSVLYLFLTELQFVIVAFPGRSYSLTFWLNTHKQRVHFYAYADSGIFVMREGGSRPNWQKKTPTTLILVLNLIYSFIEGIQW